MILTDPECVQERKTLFRVCACMAAVLLAGTTLFAALTHSRGDFINYLLSEFLTTVLLDTGLLFAVLKPEKVLKKYGPKIVKGKMNWAKTQPSPDLLALRHGSYGVAMVFFTLATGLFVVGSRMGDDSSLFTTLLAIFALLFLLASITLILLTEFRLSRKQ